MDVATLTVQKVKERFPEAIVDVQTARGETTIRVRKENLVEVMQFLRDDPDLQYNMLVDLCGVDWQGQEERFEVVYHLLSLPNRARLRVKARCTEDDPTMPTVTGLWPGANFFERETYDLLGIVFEGHPDLRRIVLPEDWEGHPLRKDYDLTQEPVAFSHNQDEIYAHKPFARE